MTQSSYVREKRRSTRIHVAGPARKAGNSLALLIPAEQAREAGIVEGTPIEADISVAPDELFGLLKDLPYRPFDRHADGLWRDRI